MSKVDRVQKATRSLLPFVLLRRGSSGFWVVSRTKQNNVSASVRARDWVEMSAPPSCPISTVLSTPPIKSVSVKSTRGLELENIQHRVDCSLVAMVASEQILMTGVRSSPACSPFPVPPVEKGLSFCFIKELKGALAVAKETGLKTGPGDKI